MSGTPRLDARGLTLVEVMIVLLLGGLLTLGLIVFYLNAQTVWLDGSLQASAQREATVLLEEITRRARHASQAFIVDSPDSNRQRLTLVAPNGDQYDFWWEASDSLVHRGWAVGGGPYSDRGPAVSFPVQRLRFFQPDSAVVQLAELTMRTASGQTVTSAGAAALYNR